MLSTLQSKKTGNIETLSEDKEIYLIQFHPRIYSKPRMHVSGGSVLKAGNKIDTKN